MKKILLFTFVSAASVILFINASHKKTTLIEAVSEGDADDANIRGEWERARLCDPSTGKIPAAMRLRELAFDATLPSDAHKNSNGKFSSALNWASRGPWNVGGRTRALAIDVTNENIILAGSVSGGMWRTTDGGISWTRVDNINGHPGVCAIAQDRRQGHTNTWYWLSGEAYGTSASGGAAFYLGNGMYKSNDGGLTWSSLVNTVTGTPQYFDSNFDAAWNVVTDSHDTVNDVVYAATLGGFFRSANGGNTWALMKGASNNTAPYYTDVAVTTTGVVYASLSSDGAVASKGIWRSDNGTTYFNILPVNFPTTYNRLRIGIDPNNENVVYFFGPTPGFGKHTYPWGGDVWNSLWKYEYLSGNGSGTGGIWTDLSQNLPTDTNPFNQVTTQSGYDIVVKIKPGNSNVMFIGGTNIYRSTSAFADSTNTSYCGGYAYAANLPFVAEYPGCHPDQHEIVFLPSNPDVMISTSDGGITKCLDNTASNIVWNILNNGYITSQFYTVAIDHGTQNDIITGGLQDNGTYFTNNTNLTSSWYQSLDGDGSYCAIADGGGTYFFSKQKGRMVKATVDQATGAMTSYMRFDPVGAAGYRFINPFVLDPNNQNVFYTCDSTHIWRNDDVSQIPFANQWDSISTNWTKFTDSISVSGEYITALGISKTPTHRLYYGTNKKNLYKVDNANTGLPSASQITTSAFPAGGYISCIAVDPDDADKVLVVISNYNVYSLFYSTDAGLNWMKVAGNLEQNSAGTGNGPSCRWAHIMHVTDGTVFAVGTSIGLFMTDTLKNNATVWVKQASAFVGSSVVDMMDFRQSDGLFAVATHGNGVFSTNITSVNDIVTANEIVEPLVFNIYPNPVKDLLNIQLDNDFLKSDISVNILNELGMSVKSISVKNVSQNNFQITVSDIANGIYYVTVENKQRKFSKGFVKF